MKKMRLYIHGGCVIGAPDLTLIGTTSTRRDDRLEQKMSDIFLNLSLIACPMSGLPLPLKTRKYLDILALNRVFISLVSSERHING